MQPATNGFAGLRLLAAVPRCYLTTGRPISFGAKT